MGCNGFAFMILTLFCEFHVDNPVLKASVLMKCSYRKVYLWGIEMIIEVGKGVVQNNSCIREIWPPIGAGSGIRKIDRHLANTLGRRKKNVVVYSGREVSGERHSRSATPWEVILSNFDALHHFCILSGLCTI